MKYRFSLQHVKTNSIEDQKWKDNILKVLKKNGLEKDNIGFFETDTAMAYCIATNPIKYWSFVRKYKLKVEDVVLGTRFLVGTMEVD